jgi:hypothetical protein
MEVAKKLVDEIKGKSTSTKKPESKHSIDQGKKRKVSRDGKKKRTDSSKRHGKPIGQRKRSDDHRKKKRSVSRDGKKKGTDSSKRHGKKDSEHKRSADQREKRSPYHENKQKLSDSSKRHGKARSRISNAPLPKGSQPKPSPSPAKMEASQKSLEEFRDEFVQDLVAKIMDAPPTEIFKVIDGVVNARVPRAAELTRMMQT